MSLQEGLRVAIDVSSEKHCVMISHNAESEAQLTIDHSGEGFEELFSRIEDLRQEEEAVWVLIEGAGGWFRPLDELMQQRGYHLLSINNRKMARFRELFTGPAKTDEIDTRRALQALDWWLTRPDARGLCEELLAIPKENRQLRLVTRRRRDLVEEKTALENRLRSHLQASSPSLMKVSKSLDNRWFLNFLMVRPQLQQLAALRAKTLLQIRGVGPLRAQAIVQWQGHATFSQDVELFSQWIQDDVRKLLQLALKIDELDQHIQEFGQHSQIYRRLKSIPGFGDIGSGELAGEIGSLDRFDGESSLALYVGSCPLDRSSGKRKGSRRPQLVNRRAKNALCQAVGRHRQIVPQSKHYYSRKKAQKGGRHTRAIRSLSRHLVRVIWRLIEEDRDYFIQKVN